MSRKVFFNVLAGGQGFVWGVTIHPLWLALVCGFVGVMFVDALDHATRKTAR